MNGAGKFITFEGGEGTGKSTQVRMLQEALAATGLDVISTREPGGTPEAERIRDALVQRTSADMDPLSEALLLFAARREHLLKKIRPALAQGQWVVCDRFADSTRAMQGDGMGLDAAVIENLYALVAGDFAPDLTIILDIDPAEGLARSTARLTAAADKAATEDRYERMSLAFHNRLRQGFLRIARENPSRCVVIDAAQNIDAIHAAVLTAVETRLGQSAGKACRGRAV